jgi:hypothetical protein
MAALAKKIVGTDTNLYTKAKKIYNAVVADIKSALQNNTLASPTLAFESSVRFCTLARSSGVPARLVAGVLIDPSRQTSNHYWTEFWLDDLGWIPVDVMLGAEAGPASFIKQNNPIAYYFGGIDNQHLAFSYGETVLSPMDPKGRIAPHERSYALQNLWEEATGSLNSYSSLWSDIQVTGVYAH